MKTKNHSVYIIAEAGVNHNGSLQLAKQLVEVAVDAKADAVKFQTFKAELLASESAPLAEYQKRLCKVNTQLELLQQLELQAQDYYELRDYAKKLGIAFLSTPFDLVSLDFLLKEMELRQIKISSGDLLNAPLLYKAAQARVNIILSTGMGTLDEIRQALGVLAYGYLNPKQGTPNAANFAEAFESSEAQEILAKHVHLLHCTTEYPAPFSEINLRAMQTIRETFHLPVGYSDHSLGLSVSTAAVALGATMIEKHFTLDKTMAGPDHSASLEPGELKQLVANIREVEQALGSSEKKPSPSELKNKEVCRKSIVAVKDIAKGERFTLENITTKRPGSGVPPVLFWDCLGKPATRAFKANELIQL